VQRRVLFRTEHVLEQDTAGLHCLNIWPRSIDYGDQSYRDSDQNLELTQSQA
jgi:hypothetical protein